MRIRWNEKRRKANILNSMRQYGSIAPRMRKVAYGVLAIAGAVISGSSSLACSNADTAHAGGDGVVHLQQIEDSARQPDRAHVSVRRRPRREDRRRLPRVRALHRFDRSPVLGRRSHADGADVAVAPGPAHSIHADALRARRPVRRRSARSSSGSIATTRRAVCRCRDRTPRIANRRLARITSGSSTCCRTARTSTSPTRAAGTRPSSRRTIRRSNGAGRRRRRR